MKTTTLLLAVCFSSLCLLTACSKEENLVIDEAVDTGAPDVTYQQPLVITKGGTYSGNFRSTDSKIPAVWVQTTEPVVITKCIIASAGDLIRCSGESQVNIHHNSLFGLTPGENSQWGRALDDYHPKSLVFQNNYVEHTGGLLLDHNTSTSTSVVIRYNVIRNTDRRRADLSAGEKRASIMFNTVSKVSGEISWNQFANLPDQSDLEHNIYMYNSGGKSGEPYLIHDNYIKGAYPYPLTAASYVGSGITIDGDPSANTMEKMSQFINAYNNQVISTCNASMNLAAGHDIHFYGNTMISSGRYPNGVKSDRFWGACCIWNASNVPAENFINNSIKNNTIGYVRFGKRTPFPDRQDWVVFPGSPISVMPGENISLRNPITLDTENAEWSKWLSKLSLNKVVVGNVTKNP
ncbi:MAG TPA: hypothetical protein VEZ17_05840 [Chitinophagaceae bacterium]|jgi:hypothetical protein|nr:hypothetical protein [Chitinophagaceae bacterium]